MGPRPELSAQPDCDVLDPINNRLGPLDRYSKPSMIKKIARDPAKPGQDEIFQKALPDGKLVGAFLVGICFNEGSMAGVLIP
jgi:hypothetical protein